MTNEGATSLLDKAPDYIMEKWFRYVNAPLPTGDGWNWGMHPSLRCVFDRYVKIWSVDSMQWSKVPETVDLNETVGG